MDFMAGVCHAPPMIILWLLFGYLTAFCALLVLVPLARRIGYVDHPGGRKTHEEVTPPIGGLVILPMSTFLLWGIGALDQGMAVLLSAVAVIFLMGACDDLAQLNSWLKFFIQIAVAAYLVIFGGAEVHLLGNLFGMGEAGLNILSIPFSIAAFVLLMNALNMMDGLDGLAGGMAAVILGWLAFAAYSAGQTNSSLQILCILVPLLAFLSLNMRHPFLKKARVFLGDAGSLSLAIIIGWFAIDLSQPPAAALLPVGIMWLLAIPVMDTLTLFFIRKLRGRHPFEPDRNHLHHRFLDKGFAAEWTTPFILLAGIACGCLAIQAPAIGVPEVVLFAGWWGVLGLYVAYSLRPGADRQFS